MNKVEGLQELTGDFDSFVNDTIKMYKNGNLSMHKCTSLSEEEIKKLQKKIK